MDKERGQLQKAILYSTVEPQSVPKLVEVLKPEGHSERDIRSRIWHMADTHDVVFGKDWKVQAGENHTRQLFFPFAEDLPSAFEPRPADNAVTVFDAKASSGE